MTQAGTPSRPAGVLGGALPAAAIVAAALPIGCQLAFAAAAVGVLGLPHGASDLAVVPAARRGSFLAAYLFAMIAVLGLWVVAPLAALAGFLLLSAIHFAIDGREGKAMAGEWGLGVLIVAGPALLHRQALAGLFESVIHRPDASIVLATVLQGIAVVALVPAARALVMRERPAGSSAIEVAVGLSATLLLPPLGGVACGFVLLHARGQTRERQRELGCATMAAYLRRVAPVLLGAAVGLAGIVALLARAGLDDTALLFAGIAALAVPHMLVTPLWRRPVQPRAVAADRWPRPLLPVVTRPAIRSGTRPSSCVTPGKLTSRPSPGRGRLQRETTR